MYVRYLCAHICLYVYNIYICIWRRGGEIERERESEGGREGDGESERVSERTKGMVGERACLCAHFYTCMGFKSHTHNSLCTYGHLHRWVAR